MRYDIVFGIDPDVEKSGLAMVNVKTREVLKSSLRFPELIKSLESWVHKCEEEGKSYTIVVEAGWLNKKATWHGSYKDSKAKYSKLGYDVGRNHEIGMLIAEMLLSMNFNVTTKKPLRKCWKGKDGKITHEEIMKVTEWTYGRSNQEERDATLLAWDVAELPIFLR